MTVTQGRDSSIVLALKELAKRLENQAKIEARRHKQVLMKRCKEIEVNQKYCNNIPVRRHTVHSGTFKKDERGTLHNLFEIFVLETPQEPSVPSPDRHTTSGATRSERGQKDGQRTARRQA